MTAPLVLQILESLNREVLNELDLAASITHPGETGRARENVIAAYLRRVVPKEFGIDTGFVFDASGGISRQVDIVIYRTGYHPVLEIGGVKHFIVESVVAVLENKASMAKRERLEDALDNIRSVKALDRTNAGTNYVVIGGQQGPFVDANAFGHQVFGAIVTERSLSNDALQDVFRTFFTKAGGPGLVSLPFQTHWWFRSGVRWSVHWSTSRRVVSCRDHAGFRGFRTHPVRTVIERGFFPRIEHD